METSNIQQLPANSAPQTEVILEPTRVKNFAQFFKNYMSIWSVVVAALPIPITAIGLIPVFDHQKNILSTYTTLFCFLLLGYIFYSRHKMAKYFFPAYLHSLRIQDLERKYRYTDVDLERVNDERRLLSMRMNFLYRRSRLINLLPFILILASLGSAIYYNALIDSVVLGGVSREAALKSEKTISSSYGALIMGMYLLIFICAEAAFILMAIKEYLQDLLKISDQSLIIDQYVQENAAEKPK